MDRLIYTAVSGMTSAMARQRVIASNMANAHTTGFRAETMQFTPITLVGDSIEVRAMNLGEVHGASMHEGTVSQTGRDLDIAMSGDTLLAVQASDGAEVYTRRGDLSISATGVLQNGDGLPVIGENGPVTVPLGVHVTLNADGGVMAFDPATPDQPPIQVDRLKLASWRGTRIEKDLTGQFRVRNGGVLPINEDGRIQPGALEGSNVSPTQVLVEMVEAQRLYDMRAKLLSTARELDEGGASLMRMS